MLCLKFTTCLEFKSNTSYEDYALLQLLLSRGQSYSAINWKRPLDKKTYSITLSMLGRDWPWISIYRDVLRAWKKFFEDIGVEPENVVLVLAYKMQPDRWASLLKRNG
ncbi:hypothetical protein NQ315_012058 [Exocentrus adspersus]|uniref:Uncharacterized protein n=1 Tax=Exocentrus adspersus TaxID=1586481 RepID=A0AAV8VXT1_9CUCU|nr:hypothetical protein NQ315_012058 [Exocentrus adspersus]